MQPQEIEGQIKRFSRYIPCLLVMIGIYIFSATPGSDLPNMGFADYFFKKGAHMFGYGLLAVTYAWALKFRTPKVLTIALLLAFFYAVSDEIHQAFTPGRHSSALDIGIDTLGSSIGLFLYVFLHRLKEKRVIN